jgi:hypothetical protein
MMLTSHNQPHSNLHFKGSELVRNLLIEMWDGLTVPFCACGWLVESVELPGIILIAALVEVAAAATWRDGPISFASERALEEREPVEVLSPNSHSAVWRTLP